MDKYEVIGSLGEGSFGRVYKAKQLSSSQIVALKVISKRGRSNSEIKDLRGECEIQRHLHHPNIIQMLDSFETDNEIVVITEFAHKELNIILGEHGYLAEDHVQTIVWDLVSALYYLHSHRVLHRQAFKLLQVLMLPSQYDLENLYYVSLNLGSFRVHKEVHQDDTGTPLYMAPELIDELPYDHNADLWSLGCIIYELLVGAPPFCTASILHLIRLIKNEQVQWPTFLSKNCISFLKGLLQKDPKKRLTWTEILNHPWVKGNILILKNDSPMPLTKTLSINTLNLKDLQRREHVNQKNGHKAVIEDEQKKSNTSKGSRLSQGAATKTPTSEKLDSENNNADLTEKINSLSLNSKKEASMSSEREDNESLKILGEESAHNVERVEECHLKFVKESTCPLKFDEETHPIETEEWSVFLLKSIEEVMGGEMISLTQPNLTNILVSPLKNCTTSPKVLTYVAKLFSIPFVVRGTSKETIEAIKKVYLEVKLVPNLVYSSKLLLRSTTECSSETIEKYKNVSDFSEEDLDTLGYIYLLISHLIHVQQDFLIQFCDSLAVLNIFPLLHGFLGLSKRRPRIVLDLVAIITHILRKTPDNAELAEKILLNTDENEENPFSFVHLLRHENVIMRERICFLILFLERVCPRTLEVLWDENVKETLEALMYDSMETVRNAAERCVDELKNKEFYE